MEENKQSNLFNTKRVWKCYQHEGMSKSAIAKKLGIIEPR